MFKELVNLSNQTVRQTLGKKQKKSQKISTAFSPHLPVWMFSVYYSRFLGFFHYPVIWKSIFLFWQNGNKYLNRSPSNSWGLMTILGLMLKPQRLLMKWVLFGEEKRSQLQNTKTYSINVFRLPLPPPSWIRALEKMKIYFDYVIRNSKVIILSLG